MLKKIFLFIMLFIVNQSFCLDHQSYGVEYNDTRNRISIFDCQNQILNEIINKLSEKITSEELEKLKKDINLRTKIMLDAASEIDENDQAKEYSTKAALLIKQVNEVYNKKLLNRLT